MTERAHAILSASGSAMWLACPPSARLNEAEPEETSEYAEEGTLGHAITELKLRRYLDRIGHGDYQTQLADLMNSRYYSIELCDAVNSAVNTGVALIDKAFECCKDPLILLEERLDFSRWVPGGFGTGDLVIVTDTYVQTVDWKFGQGEWVDAQANSQLRLYAAAALDMFGLLYGATEVLATVVQPRLDHVDTETLGAADLLHWMDDWVAQRAALAWQGAGAFNPGAKQCRWCKVRGKCRARAEQNLELTVQDFSLPALMNDGEVAAIYPHLDEFIAWAKDIQDHAHKRVLAGAQLEGLKAVAGRSVRVVTEVNQAYARLINAGFSPEQVLQPMPETRPLLALGALEKAVGAKQLQSILGELLYKPPGAPTVVPAGDKRPAIALTSSAEDDFA